MSPCSHEQADTCVLVHAQDAALNRSQSLVIKATNTDVVVIEVSVLLSLHKLGLQKMWVFFGQRLTTRWIQVHDIVSEIGPQKALGSTSTLYSLGTMQFLPFEAETRNLHGSPGVCVMTLLKSLLNSVRLQRKCLTMMSRTWSISSQCCTKGLTTSVEEARLELFARKQKPYDVIPPSHAAFREHAKHAAYQAGIIWAQETDKEPDISNTAD